MPQSAKLRAKFASFEAIDKDGNPAILWLQRGEEVSLVRDGDDYKIFFENMIGSTSSEMAHELFSFDD